MSMYTHILEAAIRERPQADTGMTTGQALATLVECRHHLGAIASSERGLDWSATALANQVAYDLALIDLARCVGLDCHPASFDQPQRRRVELEGELVSRGIQLDEPDERRSSASEYC